MIGFANGVMKNIIASNDIEKTISELLKKE